MADVVLDLRQREGVGLAHKGNGVALGTGARGAADAVYVVFAVVGQVVVEYVGHAADVQTARGHIGGDQHLDLVVGKFLQQRFALFLRHITGEDCRLVAVAFKKAPHPVGFALGVDKHD